MIFYFIFNDTAPVGGKKQLCFFFLYSDNQFVTYDELHCGLVGKLFHQIPRLYPGQDGHVVAVD